MSAKEALEVSVSAVVEAEEVEDGNQVQKLQNKYQKLFC